MRTGPTNPLDLSHSTAEKLMMHATAESSFEFVCSPMDVAELSAPKITICRRSKSAKEIVPEDYTYPFLDFMNNNPTVFHAVDALSKRLESQGFVKLSERDSWIGVLQRGGKYQVMRNGSSLIAFSIPFDYRPGNGVAVIAGHVDALTAKLKPISKKPVVEGYVQLGVAPYGGALNNTWWDRDLGIGGRVIIKKLDGKMESRLVKLDWPIARISTLAPHFGTASQGPFNKETQMTPVIGLETSEDDQASLPAGTFVAGQPARLVKAIAAELGIQDYASIMSWELELFQFEPGRLGGLSKELLFCPRIDDKLCSWSATEALIEASKDNDERGTISMCALYDNEEIGSRTKQGAESNLMSSSINRIVEALSQEGEVGPSLLGRTYANSFLVSADVANAIDNNFVDVYLPGHMPRLNVGITVSFDADGSMTTDALSHALFKRVAEKSGHTLQFFQNRNDIGGGGTIGPILSAAMGMRAIDAGMAQLSMHSIRAAIGAKDPGLGVQIFTGFYQYFEEVDREFTE